MLEPSCTGKQHTYLKTQARDQHYSTRGWNNCTSPQCPARYRPRLSSNKEADITGTRELITREQETDIRAHHGAQKKPLPDLKPSPSSRRTSLVSSPAVGTSRLSIPPTTPHIEATEELQEDTPQEDSRKLQEYTDPETFEEVRDQPPHLPIEPEAMAPTTTIPAGTDLTTRSVHTEPQPPVERTSTQSESDAEAQTVRVPGQPQSLLPTTFPAQPFYQTTATTPFESISMATRGLVNPFALGSGGGAFGALPSLPPLTFGGGGGYPGGVGPFGGLFASGLGNTKGSQTPQGSGVRVCGGRGRGMVLKPLYTPDPWSRVRGLRGSEKRTPTPTLIDPYP